MYHRNLTADLIRFPQGDEKVMQVYRVEDVQEAEDLYVDLVYVYTHPLYLEDLPALLALRSTLAWSHRDIPMQGPEGEIDLDDLLPESGSLTD